jgi:hypothetical protein
MKRKHTILFILLTCSLGLAAQSPWTRSKNGFFIQAAYQTIPTYNAVFTPETSVTPVPDRELSETAVQLYAEYGLDRKTTLTAALPYRMLKNGDFIPGTFAVPETQEGSLNGPGNISLGIKRAILEKQFRLSAALRADLPTADYDDATGLRSGYDALTIVPSMSAGMGFGKVYWLAYTGVGFRNNDYSHFLNLGGEAGVKIWKCWLVGFTELVSPFKNGDVALPLRNRITNLYVDRQGWWSLGAKTIIELTPSVGLTASFGGAGWAQYVPKSPGISAGVYWKRG